MKYKKIKINHTTNLTTGGDTIDTLQSYNDKPSWINVRKLDKMIDMTWHKQGQWHRLSGPARVFKLFNKKEPLFVEYFVNGEGLSKEAWEKHPEVIEYKIKTLINN